MAPMVTECYSNVAFMHGRAMSHARVSNNISETHGKLKGPQLVNLSVIHSQNGFFLEWRSHSELAATGFPILK